MKLKLSIIFLFAFLFLECNSSSNDNGNKQKELLQKKSIPQEKEQTTSKENVKIKETKPFDKNYLILDNSAGKFKIGNQIPFPKTSDNYKIKKGSQTRMTEEGPTEEIIYVVSENGNNILYLKPEYNYQTGKYTQNIGEIIIFSEKFKTLDGIGVNSTIEDFIKIYPNYNIWYTYVGEMYVIDTKEINAQFILSEKDFIGNLKISSDMTTLEKADFKSEAKILKIRII